MVLTNFHTHCDYCDGKGDAEEYVKEAINSNLKAIGMTCHAPVPFETDWTMQEKDLTNYADVINALKNKYKNKIEVYLGLEVDYLPGLLGHSSEILKKVDPDFTIGSIHFITKKDMGENLTVDYTQEEFEKLLKAFDGDIKALVSAYYETMREMLIDLQPDIIGHFDIVKLNNTNNRYFNENEDWYVDTILKTLDSIYLSDSIIEINTGGLTRKKINTIYPSPWILKEAKKRKIPIMINSDAHRKEDIISNFDFAKKEAVEAGYKEQLVILKGNWQYVKIKGAK